MCCGKLNYPLMSYVGRSCSTCGPLCVCVHSCTPAVIPETCVGWGSFVRVRECFEIG